MVCVAAETLDLRFEARNAVEKCVFHRGWRLVSSDPGGVTRWGISAIAIVDLGYQSAVEARVILYTKRRETVTELRQSLFKCQCSVLEVECGNGDRSTRSWCCKFWDYFRHHPLGNFPYVFSNPGNVSDQKRGPSPLGNVYILNGWSGTASPGDVEASWMLLPFTLHSEAYILLLECAITDDSVQSERRNVNLVINPRLLM